MPALTPEELAELEKLETEDQARREEEGHQAKRQHLEALRMAKRLALKHGAPGRDFVVLETVAGNVAVRRPNEIEIDVLSEVGDDKAKQDAACAALVLEPAPLEVQRLMADMPGLAFAIGSRALALCKVLREEEQGK